MMDKKTEDRKGSDGILYVEVCSQEFFVWTSL